MYNHRLEAYTWVYSRIWRGHQSITDVNDRLDLHEIVGQLPYYSRRHGYWENAKEEEGKDKDGAQWCERFINIFHSLHAMNVYRSFPGYEVCVTVPQ